MKIKDIGKLIEKNQYLVLVLIIIVAIFFRMYFFVGYSAVPQQEEIYINTMNQIYNGEYGDYLSRYMEISSNYEAGSYETIPIRLMIVYPAVSFWYLFGISELSTLMWPLLSSLGIVICCFFIGKTLFNYKVGLLASLLASFYPISIINGTRLDSDIILAFLLCLSVLFFIKAVKFEKDKNKNIIVDFLKSQKFYFLLFGMFFALALFAKPLAVILIPVFGIYLIYKRHFNKNLAFALIGFLSIFLIFCVFFQLSANNPFLYFEISSEGFRSYAIDTSSGPVFQSNNLKFWIEEDLPIIYYSPFLFNFVKPGSDSGVPNVWLFFYFLIPLFAYSVFTLKNKKIIFPLIWFVFLLIYLEIGFSSIFLDNGLNYVLIGRELRFLSILTAPSLILLAYSINSLFEIKIPKKIKVLPKILVFIIIITLIIFSFKTLEKTHYELTDPTSDIKDTYNYLLDKPYNKIYCDNLGVNLLNFYFGYKETNHIKSIESNDQLVNNSYILIGGSRNSVYTGEYIEGLYPEFTNNTQDNWLLVKEFKKEIEPWRNSNLKIYYIS